MDINLYQRDDLEKRIIINFGNYVFSQADISENLSFQQSVNTDGDFVIGVASCAQMDFDINNMAQKITDSEFSGPGIYLLGWRIDIKRKQKGDL